MSTQQQRQEWRELAEAATVGKGEIHASEHYDYSLYVSDDAYPIACFEYPTDALFYAAARAAVPQLLADVDAAEARADALAAELERVRAQLDAVPVGAITTVVRAATHAYDMREDRQDVTAITEWLRQRLPEPMLWKASTRPLWTDDTQQNGKPQSTPEEDNAAAARIARMDELTDEWGMGGREIDAWPVSVQDEYQRLVEAQNEYEAKYC